MTEPADLLHFEDIQVGQVVPMGACAVDGDALDGFIARFAPHWPASDGAPEAMVYALWRRLADEAERGRALLVLGLHGGDGFGLDLFAEHSVSSCLNCGCFDPHLMEGRGKPSVPQSGRLTGLVAALSGWDLAHIAGNP